MRRPLLLAAAALALAVPVAAQAEPAVVAAPESRDRLALTVYQGGFALIEDSRVTDLPTGAVTVHLPGVADTLIGPSVHIDAAPRTVRAIGHGGPTADTASLLRAHEGREITVVRLDRDGNEVRRRARILRAEPQVISEIDGEIHVGLPGEPVFDALPPGVPLHPGLAADVAAGPSGRAVLALRYMAHGMSWSADHVVTLNAARDGVDVTTWATLGNHTGQAWTGARLALVAGTVRLPDGPPDRAYATLRSVGADSMMAMEMADAAPPQREAADGGHVYRLDAPVNLQAGETRQIRLLASAAIPARVVHEDRGGQPHVYRDHRPGDARSHPIRVLVIDNTAAEPLPAGMARVYAATQEGEQGTRFLGGAPLPALPVGEEARLDIGQAFDLTVERTQTAFRRLGDRMVESSHRIILRNGGESAATVEVIETLPGDWEIIDESQPHTRKDAARAQWSVDINAGGRTEVTYTVRNRF